MTDNEFFIGFLAALRVAGIDEVATRNDEHHRRFGEVVRALRERQEQGDEAARAMPQVLIEDAFTRRYDEFEIALLDQQGDRLVGARNPYYPKVDLVLSEARALNILSRFTEEQRALFSDLAHEFAGSELAVRVA